MNTTAFLSIGRRIKAQCPSIKHIDLFNQQYTPDKEGQSHPFAKPAVLIEFGQTSWVDSGNGVQEGDGLVRIHVVMETYKGFYKIFDLTENLQAAELAHYNAPKEVHAALHNWQPDGTAGPLTRPSSIPDHDFDNIIVEVMEYEFRDLDESADEEATYVTRQIKYVQTPGDIKPAGELKVFP